MSFVSSYVYLEPFFVLMEVISVSNDWIWLIDVIVTWADPDTHKPRRWKASSSPKVIYVAYIPTMFAKHIEQVN